jgi:hypothetical protein
MQNGWGHVLQDYVECNALLCIIFFDTLALAAATQPSRPVKIPADVMHRIHQDRHVIRWREL